MECTIGNCISQPSSIALCASASANRRGWQPDKRWLTDERWELYLGFIAFIAISKHHLSCMLLLWFSSKYLQLIEMQNEPPLHNAQQEPTAEESECPCIIDNILVYHDAHWFIYFQHRCKTTLWWPRSFSVQGTRILTLKESQSHNIVYRSKLGDDCQYITPQPDMFCLVCCFIFDWYLLQNC